MNKIIYILLLFVVFQAAELRAQHFDVQPDTFIYKEVDGHELEMIVYKPQLNSNLNLPAIVFFFGGGWVGGSPGHFRLQAEYLASRGMVAVCPDYRTKSRHGTSPFESVKDARSAMRYLKIKGAEMGIDTSKIVASGGSAGGHLAACTAIIDGINDPADNLSVSPVPMALVLFNPVVDTGKRGYGQEKVKGREFEISPVHHITSGVPPTLIMHGKEDATVPYENVERFEHAMIQHENECTLIGYKNKGHGFFNYNKSPKYFQKTLKQTESFLEERNLLMGKSWLRKYIKQLNSVELGT